MRSSRHPGPRNHSHSTPFGVVVLSLPPNRRFPSVTSGYSYLSPSGTSATDHLHRRNGRALSGSPLRRAVRGSEQGDVLLLGHEQRRLNASVPAPEPQPHTQRFLNVTSGPYRTACAPTTAALACHAASDESYASYSFSAPRRASAA